MGALSLSAQNTTEPKLTEALLGQFWLLQFVSTATRQFIAEHGSLLVLNQADALTDQSFFKPSQVYLTLDKNLLNKKTSVLLSPENLGAVLNFNEEHLETNLSTYLSEQDVYVLQLDRAELKQILAQNGDLRVFEFLIKHPFLCQFFKKNQNSEFTHKIMDLVEKDLSQTMVVEKNKKLIFESRKVIILKSGLLQGKEGGRASTYIKPFQSIFFLNNSSSFPEYIYVSAKSHSEIFVVNFDGEAEASAFFDAHYEEMQNEFADQTRILNLKSKPPVGLDFSYTKISANSGLLKPFEYCKEKLIQSNELSAYYRLSIYNLSLFLNSKVSQNILDDLSLEFSLSYNKICEQLESYGFTCRKKNFNGELEFNHGQKYVLLKNGHLYVILSKNNNSYVCFETKNGFLVHKSDDDHKFFDSLLIEVSPHLIEATFGDSAKAIFDKPDHYGAIFYDKFLSYNSDSVKNMLVYKFFLTILVLIVPSYIYSLLNQTVYQRNTQLMGQLITGLLMFLAFQAISVYFYNYYSNKIASNFKTNLINSFYRIFTNQTTQVMRPGFITTRLGLTEFTLNAIKFKKFEIPIYMVLLGFYFLFIGQYSFLASFLLLFIFASCAGVVYMLRKKGGFTELNTAQLKQELFEYFLESIENMKALRLLNKKQEQINRLNKHVRNLLIGSAQYSNGLNTINSIGIVLFKCGTVFILYFVLTELIQHRSSPAQLFGVSFYLSYLYSPFQSINTYLTSYNTTGLMGLPIQFFKSEAPEILNKATQSFQFEKHIIFDKVSFRYNNQSALVLSECSFKINRGDVIAIVGRASSGKSTLGKMIACKNEVQYGKVTIDGKDFRNLDSYSLFGQFSYVPQTPIVFDGTVLGNLIPQNFDSDLGEIIKTSEATGLDQIINRRFKGDYFAKINAQGQELSAGQKQLISLTRALLEKPEVIVLDEPTAFMDEKTGARFIDQVIKNREEQTIVLITSDLNKALKADKIFVVKNGRIVEEGDHNRLVNLGGEYSELYRCQVGEQ